VMPPSLAQMTFKSVTPQKRELSQSRQQLAHAIRHFPRTVLGKTKKVTAPAA